MPVANPDLEWAVEDVRDRAKALALFKAYDEGEHRLLFATEKYRNTFADLFREFADNLCDDVVNGITDRLQITSWSAADKGLGASADAAWERNRGESRTGAIHRHAFRDGDGFAIVQEDKNRKGRFYKQDPRTMCVRYDADNPDEMALVGKVWKDGSRYRANLYYPDRTERYATRGLGQGGGLPKAEAFKPLQAGDPGLVAAGLEDFRQEVDHIPVYHFPNGELSEYGRSILVGVIPLQDALNKAVADMLVSMEFTAYPQRHATGLQDEIDPVTGQVIDRAAKAGPGSILKGPQGAVFGQFDAATPDAFLAVQDAFKIEIARKGLLPPHAITLRSGTSTPPSGVSLLVAEGRTIKCARDRQRDWGPEHRRMMADVLSIDMGTTVDPNDLKQGWAPPETRDMKALLEELGLKVALGLPEREALIEAGYDPDDVDKWLGDAAQTNADAQAALDLTRGGRPAVTPFQARTLNQDLGVPGGPVQPNGAVMPAMAGA